MKAFWTILAIILGALALGGLASAGKHPDMVSRIGDIVIAGLLALGAWLSWRKARRTGTSA